MSVKLSILFKKKAELSESDFDSYWSNEHAALFTQIPCVQANITRYEQLHAVGSRMETLKSMGIPTAPYDGCAEFLFKSMDDLLATLGDSDWEKVVGPDLSTFIDLQSCQMLVGNVESKI